MSLYLSDPTDFRADDYTPEEASRLCEVTMSNPLNCHLVIRPDGMSDEDFRHEVVLSAWKEHGRSLEVAKIEPATYLFDGYVYSEDANRFVDYEMVEAYFDREICDELHNSIVPCTQQAFFDAYCKRHLEKFGEGLCW